MDKKIALQLFKSIMGPHLDYCDTVYMTANVDVLNKLQLLQNVCCRIILRENRYASIDEMHKELQIMKLVERRDYHLGQLCHKNIHYDGTASLAKFFVKLQQGRTTRQTTANHMGVPKYRTVMGSKAISVRGPKYWNKLPNDLKIVVKLNPFSTALRSHVMESWDNHPT